MKPLLRQLLKSHGIVMLAGMVICLAVACGTAHTTYWHDLLLFDMLPVVFLGVQILIAHHMWGIWTARADRIDAQYPGPRGHLVLVRCFAPVVGAAGPYLLLALLAIAGGYWHVQMWLYEWPAVPGSAWRAAWMFLRPVIPIWIAWGFVQCVALLADAGDPKRSLWGVRGLLVGGATVLALYSMVVMKHLSHDQMLGPTKVQMIACLLGPLFAAWYTALVRPMRSTRFLNAATAYHVVFVAGVLTFFYGALTIIPDTVPWIPWLTCAVVCGVSWYRAGWVAGILCAPLGISCWTMVFWLFTFPDTARCACTHCGATTFTWRRACQACKTALHGIPSTIVERIAACVRMSTAVTITFMVVPLLVLAFYTPVKPRKAKPEPLTTNHVSLTCVGPYGVSNIVISVNGIVRGTDTWDYVYYGDRDPLNVETCKFLLNGMPVPWTHTYGAIAVLPGFSNMIRFARLLTYANQDTNRIPPTLLSEHDLYSFQRTEDLSPPHKAYNAQMRRWWASLPSADQAARLAWYGNSNVRKHPVLFTRTLASITNDGFLSEFWVGHPGFMFSRDGKPIDYETALREFIDFVVGENLFTPRAVAHGRDIGGYWYAASEYLTGTVRTVACNVIRLNERKEDERTSLPELRRLLRSQLLREDEPSDMLYRYLEYLGDTSRYPATEEDRELLQALLPASKSLLLGYSNTRYLFFSALTAIDQPWSWELLRQGWKDGTIPLGWSASPRAFRATNAVDVSRTIAGIYMARRGANTYGPLLHLYARLPGAEAAAFATNLVWHGVINPRAVRYNNYAYNIATWLAYGDGIHHEAIADAFADWWCGAIMATGLTRAEIATTIMKVADRLHERPCPAAKKALERLRSIADNKDWQTIDGYIAEMRELEQLLMPVGNDRARRTGEKRWRVHGKEVNLTLASNAVQTAEHQTGPGFCLSAIGNSIPLVLGEQCDRLDEVDAANGGVDCVVAVAIEETGETTGESGVHQARHLHLQSPLSRRMCHGYSAHSLIVSNVSM